MAFSLKDRIFSMFGKYITSNDSYINVDGKGILQRYNEIVGEDYDQHLGVDIRNLLDMVYVPSDVRSDLLPYLQEMMGASLFLGNDDVIKRKMLRYANKINNLKGTKRAYYILFRFLGFTSSLIIEFPGGGTFDEGNTDQTYTPLTFDDDPRTFDNTCPSCSDIIVKLYGTLTLTDDLLKAVYRIIEYNTPINVRVRSILYNDGAIPAEGALMVYIDAIGDLYYNNVSAPLTTLSLDSNGDLNVSGNNAGNYEIDGNGDLVFNT